MSKVVLTTKVNSGYDDQIEERYHFPKQYLKAALQAEGDFAIYYAPGDERGLRNKSYFAIARINRIEADPQLSGHFYARIEPRTFIEFLKPVPLKAGEKHHEMRLNLPNGRTNAGWIQQSIRPIPEEEFELIVSLGMADLHQTLPIAPQDVPGLFEDSEFFERPVVQRIVNEKYRDAVFAQQIRAAYDSTCAFTGLRIINGGNRAEIEAAHIKPVEYNGPDSVRNGIAASRTAHWMFDRGLIAISDSRRLLVATDLVPEPARRMLRQDGTIIPPTDMNSSPSNAYLYWHRQNVFKGGSH